MQKRQIIDEICAQLLREQQTAEQSAKSAQEGATHEEARAENQYDTRGLEASYLAGAQAKRAQNLAASINRFKNMRIRDCSPDDRIGLGVLVTLDGLETKQLYFLAPDGGGLKVTLDGDVILVITPDSPIGRALTGKSSGDFIEIKVKKETREYEITRVQ